MDHFTSKSSTLSIQTLKRLPNYYNYLRELHAREVEYVAAPEIAGAMGLNEVQVRKDLAAVSKNPGKPRKGFEVGELLGNIGACLGYHNQEDAVLVGAGKLGKALLDYKAFEEHGVRIVAAFDCDADTIASSGGKILLMEKLPSLCKRLNAHIGIITVPEDQAQAVCDTMVENGILAIWNFAPVHLRVPEGVLVQNENLAASLALLSRELSRKMH